MKKLTVLLLILSTAVLPTRLWAGSASAEDNIFPAEQITTFAKSVERYAAQRGARAFIIGRVGRPEDSLPEGIHFTHTAVAIYSSIALEDGSTRKGYAVHNLYQKTDAVNESELITDYPTDFFWSAKALKAGIIIPSADLQRRLISLYAEGKAQAVHVPSYSAIANPFTSRYQNCTEYTLDVINAAIYKTQDKAKLKANAQAHFTPVVIQESPIKILLGSMLMKDIARDDHSGPVATATFSSIARYLNDNGLLKQASILMADGQSVALR
jgi:hypothetical protein